MSTENVTPIRKPFESPSDSIDLLDNKLTQLASLLTCMYGVGAEWCEVIGATHRDNIIWIAADLAQESRRLLEDGRREALVGPR